MTQKTRPSKTKKEKDTKKSEQKIETQIAVSIIGALVTIILAILSFPPLIKMLDSKWNPTPTFVVTETFTPYPTDTPDASPEVLAFPTFTQTIPPPSTDTPAAAPQTGAETMNVQLTFSSSAGKAPLTVNFNAKNSFLSRTDGTTLSCIQKNVCSFTWSVRLGGTNIHGPSLGDNAFSYTFQKKGEYVVVVYVCRGEVCNYSAASISAK